MKTLALLAKKFINAPPDVFCVFLLNEINNKLIKEWDFIAPTYGYFIIQLKNIRIDENKWGINIFCNGGMILPSQFMDPPPIPVEKIQYLFQSEIDGLMSQVKQLQEVVEKMLDVIDAPNFESIDWPDLRGEIGIDKLFQKYPIFLQVEMIQLITKILFP